MFSYLDHLECTQCNAIYPCDRLSNTSSCCGKVLFARYDLARLRQDVDRDALAGRRADMWRFSELLPVGDAENVITLGEGGTPLLAASKLAAELGLERLFVKEEGLNPTGTFKARGISAAVSRSRELGATGFAMPSAGNAAGAAAAYCARAGAPLKAFMPQDAPDAKKKECLLASSELNLVEGHIGDAGRQAAAAAAEHDLFDLSTLKEPYRAEGKKTMGLEIAQQLGWQLPDTIVLSHRRRHRHHRYAQGFPGVAGTGLGGRLPSQIHRGASRGLPAHRKSIPRQRGHLGTLGPTPRLWLTACGCLTPSPTISYCGLSGRPGVLPLRWRTMRWSRACTNWPPRKESWPAPKERPP